MLSRPERWIPLLLVAACLACANSPSPAPRPMAGDPIHLSESEVVAIAELLRLEDSRAYDDARIRTHLENPHPEVRRRAALATGRIQDRRAVAPLIQALRDSSSIVRAEAAFALGQVGDSSAHIVGELAGRGLDRNEDAATRAEAMAALGKLRSTGARAAIMELLESAALSPEEGPPTAVVGEALLAIWKFSRVAGTTAPIVTISRLEDPESRWRAVYALMRLGDPATITALLERRHDADPLVRALAMRGLRPSIVDSAGQRAAAVEALVDATRDPHPHVRINALRALGAFQISEHTSTLAAGLQDRDANVAVAAAEALTEQGDAAAARALESVISDPGNRGALRGAALTTLLRIIPERGLASAGTFARSADWLTRLYAVRALGAHPTEASISPLTALAHDRDPRISAAALSGLASLDPEIAPGLKRLFTEKLGASDIVVRAAALSGLAARADAADLPLLLDAYERAQHDVGLNDAARAAIAALGRLARKDASVQSAFFLRFSRSPDPIVRRDVERLLGSGGSSGNWGAVFPVETRHAPAFYTEIVRTLVVPDLAGAPRPRALIHTATGTITVELAAAAAPLTVYNLMTLAERGYFDDFRWHRVVPNFVLQDGDPRGDGLGGPGYAIRDEFNRLRYLRGTLGMALDGADTGGSQFFFAHAPQPHLDGAYTVFGQVVDGFDAMDAVAQDDPIYRIEISPAVVAVHATNPTAR